MMVSQADSFVSHCAPERAAALQAIVAPYKRSDLLKSCWQVANSLLPFCGLWYAMYLSFFWSYWLTLLLAVPTAGFLVRIFTIQHDCGHHSFFQSRRANDFLGIVCGVLTVTPYHLWRLTHARHHVTSGDLNHRGHGDIGTLTVQEYLQRSSFGRLKYRAYRHPLNMFFLGAAFLFIIRQRLTSGIPRTWRRERISVHVTNLAIVGILGIAWCTIGLWTAVLIELPIMVLAAAAGSWLFFVQHQFEDAYWQPHATWDFVGSALRGSSFYRLPRVLRWFTGNIGYHHIHHLNSRIPNYNLSSCHDSEPAFQQVKTMGLRDSLMCPSLKLWDEKSERMVTFAQTLEHSAPTPYAVVKFVIRRPQTARGFDASGIASAARASVATPATIIRNDALDCQVSQPAD